MPSPRRPNLQLQSRDIAILAAVARYYLVDRRIIQQELDIAERAARKRLKQLAEAGYLNRHELTPCGMCYYLTPIAKEILWNEHDDPRYLLCRHTLPQTNLDHQLDVTRTHFAFRQACRLNPEVRMPRFINEYDVVSQAHPHGQPQQPTLHTRFSKSQAGKDNIWCRPDALFAIAFRRQTCLFFLEEDRNTTTSTESVLDKKTPGFRAMWTSRMHRQAHFLEAFPNTLDEFRILLVTTGARRRDSFKRSAYHKLHGHDDAFASAWRFVAKSDLTGAFLHEPIVHTCFPDADPVPIVNPDVSVETVEAPQLEAVSA